MDEKDKEIIREIEMVMAGIDLELEIFGHESKDLGMEAKNLANYLCVYPHLTFENTHDEQSPWLNKLVRYLLDRRFKGSGELLKVWRHLDMYSEAGEFQQKSVNLLAKSLTPATDSETQCDAICCLYNIAQQKPSIIGADLRGTLERLALDPDIVPSQKPQKQIAWYANQILNLEVPESDPEKDFPSDPMPS